MVKRTILTKELIISEAIALADHDGLSAMSMRKLAVKLNIQAMSLYYHFKTKDELMALMADSLVVQISGNVDENLTDSDWRTIILNRAIAAKSIF